jgi:hypothetical protein
MVKGGVSFLLLRLKTRGKRGNEERRGRIDETRKRSSAYRHNNAFLLY